MLALRAGDDPINSNINSILFGFLKAMGEVLYIALTRPCTYLQMSGSSVLVKTCMEGKLAGYAGGDEYSLYHELTTDP